jgi:hypothetical protein
VTDLNCRSSLATSLARCNQLQKDEFDTIDNEEIIDDDNEHNQEDEAGDEELPYDSGVTPAMYRNGIYLQKLKQSHRRYGADFGKTISKEGIAQAGRKKFEQKNVLQNRENRKRRLQNEMTRCDSAVTYFCDREATGPGALQILLEGSTPFLEEEADAPEYMKLYKMALA